MEHVIKRYCNALGRNQYDLLMKIISADIIVSGSNTPVKQLREAFKSLQGNTAFRESCQKQDALFKGNLKRTYSEIPLDTSESQFILPFTMEGLLWGVQPFQVKGMENITVQSGSIVHINRYLDLQPMVESFQTDEKRYCAHERVNKMKQMVENHPIRKHPFWDNFRDVLYKTDSANVAYVWAEVSKDFSESFNDYLEWEYGHHLPWAVKACYFKNQEAEKGLYEEDEFTAFRESYDIERWMVEAQHHIDLNKRFFNKARELSKIKLTKEQLQETKYTINSFRNMKKEFVHGEIAAVLAAIETITPFVAGTISNGCSKTKLNLEDYVYFTLHIEVDDEHAKRMWLAWVELCMSDPDACEQSERAVQIFFDN